MSGPWQYALTWKLRFEPSLLDSGLAFTQTFRPTALQWFLYLLPLFIVVLGVSKFYVLYIFSCFLMVSLKSGAKGELIILGGVGTGP